jgi:hypothetical protein
VTRFVALTVLASLFCLATAQGALYTLTDDNSTAVIDDASSAGMTTWTVDGTNHMFQQWFWYRVGNTAEASIDTLAFIVGGVTDTNFDGDDDTLYLRYGNDQAATQYTVEIRFTLDGGPAGSRLSDIAEQITITNTSTSALDFHFFQYSDFDLGGDGAPNDTVQLINANTIRQSDPDWTASETVATPAADGFELDFFAVTRTRLNDGVATTLGNAFGAGPVGAGDVTWAFQWDRTIEVGGGFQISKDKNMTVIPEPAMLVLLLIGGLAMLRRRR